MENWPASPPAGSRSSTFAPPPNGKKPASSPAAAADWPADAVQAAALEYRHTAATGVWLNEFSIYLDNRPLGGRSGPEGVAPVVDDWTVLALVWCAGILLVFGFLSVRRFSKMK